MTDEKYVRKLRTKLEKALAKDREETALELLEDLEDEEKDVPRWPHKRGDVLRKLERYPEAIEAYERAVDLYAEQGFLARAVAMARTILDLDPARLDILERVDPQAARTMQQQRRERQRSVRLAQQQLAGAAHPAVIPDAAAPAYNHPAILPDSTPPPAAPQAFNHPAILPDSAPPPAAAATYNHPAVLPDSAPPPAPGPAVAARGQAAAVAPPQPTAPAAPPALPRSRPANDGPPPPPPSQQAARVPSKRPITLSRLSLPPAPAKPPPSAPTASFFGPEETAVAEIYSHALAGAQELAPAKDKGPDETRFEDVNEGQAAIEIDIGDLEWAEPEDEPSADALLDLPLFPLFADVEKAALSDMVRGSEIVHLADGEALVRRGDPGDALFGIIEGVISVVIPGRAQPLSLGEGEVVGESCLLKDEKRSADVLAKGPVTALRIPRDVLLSLVAEHPSVAEVLLRMLVRRLLGNLLQGSPLFEGLDGAGRGAMARSFETRRAAAGTMLAKAGKQMDGMYITLTGTLAVAQPGEAPHVVGPGSMFGLPSLMSQAPSAISVQARVNLVVLRLPSSAFAQVAMAHPMILARFSELASADIVNVSN